MPYLESRYDFKIPKQILIGFHKYAELLFSPIILCLDNHQKKSLCRKVKNTYLATTHQSFISTTHQAYKLESGVPRAKQKMVGKDFISFSPHSFVHFFEFLRSSSLELA